MKTVISSNEGYKYLVEAKKVSYPDGYTHLKFLTEWDGARKDGSEQTRFEIFLTDQQLANLKDIL
jgi:hypothetical protein